MDFSEFTLEKLQKALVVQQPYPAVSQFPDFEGSLVRVVLFVFVGFNSALVIFKFRD